MLITKAFNEVLPHTHLGTYLDQPVWVDGKKFMITGLNARPTAKGREEMIGCGVTMADLFYLEPPRTFADIQRRIDRYSLEVDIALTEFVTADKEE